MNVATRMLQLATMLLVIAVTGSAHAKGPLRDLFYELHLLFILADVTVAGTITELDDETFVLDVEQQFQGDPLKSVWTRRFENWTCAWRWAQYAEGQRVLLFLNEPKEQGEPWRIVGGDDGEMPLLADRVIAGRPIDDRLETHVVDGARIHGSTFSLSELDSALEGFRTTFAWRKEVKSGFTFPTAIWPRVDEASMVRYSKSSALAAHVTRQLRTSERWAERDPEPRQGGTRDTQSPEPQEPAPDAVTGTVWYHDGTPAPDALVVVHDVPQGLRPGTQTFLGSARTDADGRFTMGGLVPRESIKIRAQSPGLLPMVNLGAPGRHYEFVLRPGYTLHGRVADAETGEPIEGAELTYPSPSWDEATSTLENLKTRTDRDGRFTIGPVFRLGGGLNLLIPGRLPEFRRYDVKDTPNKELEFLVERGEELHFKLIEHESEEPLRNHEVAIGSGRYVTNDKGDLHLVRPLNRDHVPPAADTLLVTPLGGWCRTTLRLLTFARYEPIPVRVSRGGRVFGRVVSEAGLAIPFAHVAGHGETLKLGSGTSIDTRTVVRADAEGRFEFSPALAGTKFSCRATRTGWRGSDWTSIPFPHAGEDAEFPDIVLSGGAKIRGVVRCEESRCRARVVWTGDGGHGVTESDDRGEYEISGLPAGEYEIMASRGDIHSESETVVLKRNGRKRLNLTIPSESSSVSRDDER